MKTVDQRIKSKVDGRKNANVKKGKVLRMQDIHSDYVEYFLDQTVGGEHCLNVCCGSSIVGDIRLDISPNTNRTRYGDLFEIHNEFKPRSIPFVIIDPPFDFYNPNSRIIKEKCNGNPYLWQFRAFDIVSKCLILRRNLIMANIPAKFKEYRLIRDSRPSATILEVLWK